MIPMMTHAHIIAPALISLLKKYPHGTPKDSIKMANHTPEIKYDIASANVMLLISGAIIHETRLTIDSAARRIPQNK